VLPIEKFMSLAARIVIMLQQLIIQFMLYYQSSGILWELKNKRKFPIFSSYKWFRGGQIQTIKNMVI